MSAFKFQKAKREKFWIKVLLTGPSGSGKSYTGLRLATGLFNKVGGTGIAVIDTENGRIRYYAQEFDFFDVQLSEPYTPESYMEALDGAVREGFKVILIDSLSHEWKYLNEVHDKMPGNSFTNWRPLKNRHGKFMEKILQSPIHIVATSRGKDEYVMEEKNNKQMPKKVGVGTEQEKSIEYNYTVTFNIDQQSHVASVMKDNTHIFEGRFDVLTEKDGERLADWSNSGEGELPKYSKPITNEGDNESDLDKVLSEIKDKFAEKMDGGVPKDTLYGIVQKYHGQKNFMSIKDKEIASNVLKEIKEVK